MELRTRTLEDTAATAQTLAPHLRFGCSYGLIGPLGAGKTTLVRFLLKQLGGEGSLVSSPTFVLQHIYSLQNGRAIEHWDLYRLSDLPLELLEAPSPQTLRLIEWSDKFPPLSTLLAGTIELSFLKGSGMGRRILWSGAE